MDVPSNAARLRIYVGENDTYGRATLAQALVLRARDLGLAGATALHGMLGYGQPAHAREAELLLARDKPIVIEVVDTRDKIDLYLAAVEPMIGSGLITIEDIRVLRYGAATGQAGLC
jgi:PII-like signaling protein